MSPYLHMDQITYARGHEVYGFKVSQSTNSWILVYMAVPSLPPQQQGLGPRGRSRNFKKKGGGGEGSSRKGGSNHFLGQFARPCCCGGREGTAM